MIEPKLQSSDPTVKGRVTSKVLVECYDVAWGQVVKVAKAGRDRGLKPEWDLGLRDVVLEMDKILERAKGKLERI